MLREFSIYRQEFKFKVSYMILIPQEYIPKGATFVGRFHAKSKMVAATWLKSHLDTSLTRSIGDGNRYVA